MECMVFFLSICFFVSILHRPVRGLSFCFVALATDHLIDLYLYLFNCFFAAVVSVDATAV